jgi:hypothetical protein
VNPITYSLQFRGRATPLGANLAALRLTAPSSAHVTTIGATGVRARFDEVIGGEAVLCSEVSFDELSFDDRGTIDFGRGNTLRFRSIGSRLTHCPNAELRHGVVIREVEGGDGQFADCEGLIASNFLVSDTGEVTENHTGVIFVAPPRSRPDARG